MEYNRTVTFKNKRQNDQIVKHYQIEASQFNSGSRRRDITLVVGEHHHLFAEALRMF